MHFIQIISKHTFGILVNAVKMKGKDISSSIEALNKAVQQTTVYVTRIEKGEERSRDKERELYEVWFSASVPMAKVDKALAMTFEQKAEYWLDPELYTDDKIKDLGISLIRMKSELKALKYES